MNANFLELSAAQAEQLIQNSSGIADFIYSDDVQESDKLLNLDKAWHGLHYLLTGSDWEGEEPLRSVVLGGSEIGEDIGYGSARLIDKEKVEDISRALNELSSDELTARFDLGAMENLGIYGIGDEDDLEWLLDAFCDIKALYNEAASNGNPVITFVN